MPACKPPRIEQAERIQALSLAAGDTLIITMPSVHTKEQRERIKASAGESLPENVKVMVLDPGVMLSAIYSQASIDRLASAIEAMGQQFPGHVPPRPIPQPRKP